MFDGLRADSSLVDKPDGKPLHNGLTEFGKVHCKKSLATFPSPYGMSLTKLSLGSLFFTMYAVGIEEKLIERITVFRKTFTWG
jgi:hypothetical protein